MQRRGPLAWIFGCGPSLSCARRCGGEPGPPAAVVFLHGSGDSGEGFRRYLKAVDGSRLLEMLRLGGAALAFPDSGKRPYRLAGGRPVAVWYDRKGLPPSAPEDTESVEASVGRLLELVLGLRAAGVPRDRLAVGGFSMGGGIALQLALRHPEAVGLVFALSSYFCDDAAVYRTLEAAGRPAPPRVLMAHGTADRYIDIAWGRNTAQRLEALGVPVQFVSLPGVGHEVVEEEVELLATWLLPALRLDEGARAGSSGAGAS